MQPVVQVSLDLTDITEALETAEMAVRAGVDWLEVGTPLILAEGMHGVRALREAYPSIPLVADLKTMDGGWLETEVMANAGATHVVVMGRAHRETVELVVKAGEEFGVEVMGDNLAMPDPVEGAKYLADLGCDYVIHHVGYDHRTVRAERGEPVPSPLDRLGEIVDAVDIPVQAVGGAFHRAGRSDAGIRSASRCDRGASGHQRRPVRDGLKCRGGPSSGVQPSACVRGRPGHRPVGFPVDDRFLP